MDQNCEFEQVQFHKNKELLKACDPINLEKSCKCFCQILDIQEKLPD